MKEKISALLDGEVNDLEHERALRALGADPALGAVWERYHLAGNAIRRELEVMVSPDLADRIQERLRHENPEAENPLPRLSPWGRRVPHLRHPWRSRRIQKFAAGLAIAASVAALAILNLPPVLAPGATPVAKQSSGLSATTVANALQARPEQQNALSPYLMQHGEFTPAAGMNGMLSYVRVVGRNSAMSETAPAQK